MTRISMKWFICFGKSACHKHFTNTSARRKISFIWNCKNMLQPKVSEIITHFLSEKDEHYKQFRNNLSHYKNIFQYVYSNVFPEMYCSTERRGCDLKSNFHIIFKTYKDKKKLKSSLGKNSYNYEGVHNETFVYEQKPTEIDEFHKTEEKKVKERVEKTKNKRREVAEGNKFLKKK